MQFDCAFMLAIISPVVTGKTKVDRCAVNSIQRIFELEFMFRSDCYDPIKNFFKQCLQYRSSPDFFKIFSKRYRGMKLKS